MKTFNPGEIIVYKVPVYNRLGLFLKVIIKHVPIAVWRRKIARLIDAFGVSKYEQHYYTVNNNTRCSIKEPQDEI